MAAPSQREWWVQPQFPKMPRTCDYFGLYGKWELTLHIIKVGNAVFDFCVCATGILLLLSVLASRVTGFMVAPLYICSSFCSHPPCCFPSLSTLPASYFIPHWASFLLSYHTHCFPLYFSSPFFKISLSLRSSLSSLSFWDGVHLSLRCSSGCPRTLYVDQPGLDSEISLPPLPECCD